LSGLPTPWDNLRLKQTPGNMTVKKNFVTRSYLHTIRPYAIACFIVAIFGPLAAETVKIEGIIAGRNGDEVIVAANTARFGQLDYYIWDEVTVYFDNGQVKVDPKYEAQLLALAEKDQTVDGYAIEVKGCASTSGSASLNRKLSEDRAANVTNILLQKGHVSLTRMLAPGAMGEAHQVGNDKSAEGREPARRGADTAEQGHCGNMAGSIVLNVRRSKCVDLL
jgi:hypothetical protein